MCFVNSKELDAGCWLVLLPVEGERGVFTLQHSAGAVCEEGFLCHRPLALALALLSPGDTPA